MSVQCSLCTVHTLYVYVCTLLYASDVQSFVKQFKADLTPLLIGVELQEYHGSSFTGARINDIRVVGLILVLLLCGIALIGLDWEAKVSKYALHVVMLISIIHL